MAISSAKTLLTKSAFKGSWPPANRTASCLLRLSQPVRQRDFPLPRRPGVLALFGLLGGVPRLGPAPLAGTLGQDQLAVKDAAASRVIVLAPAARHGRQNRWLTSPKAVRPIDVELARKERAARHREPDRPPQLRNSVALYSRRQLVPRKRSRQNRSVDGSWGSTGSDGRAWGELLAFSQAGFTLV